MSQPLPALRARLALARERFRAFRPSPELRAGLDAVKARMDDLRDDLADQLAEQLVDSTDDADIERLGSQVYAAVVLALPGEAAGPIGLLGEHVLAFVVAYEVRALLRVIHRRAEARLAAMEQAGG